MRSPSEPFIPHIYDNVDSSITFRAYKKLSLPASLDALERPIGLPPSLLQKAEEVQSKNGPDQIERLLESVQELGTQNRDLLEEVDTLVFSNIGHILPWLGIGRRHTGPRSPRRRGFPGKDAGRSPSYLGGSQHSAHQAVPKVLGDLRQRGTKRPDSRQQVDGVGGRNWPADAGRGASTPLFPSYLLS